MSDTLPPAASTPASITMKGPPYFPPGPAIGGLPTTAVDVPISAVLLALFAISAATHMTLFQRARILRRRLFLPSVLLFGLSMARIVALSLRIAWSQRPAAASVAIAAQVFFAAGVVVLFVVNAVLAHRVFRAYHALSHPAWLPRAKLALRLLIFAVVGMLVATITATVRMFYTLDPSARRACRDVQLVSGTFFAVVAFLPVPVVLASARLLPRPAGVRGFGVERSTGMGLRVGAVLFTATILTLGAGFRVGTAFDVRAEPTWFHHRAAYYCFNYVIELVVVYFYAGIRMDRLFCDLEIDAIKGKGEGGESGSGGSGTEKDREGSDLEEGTRTSAV